MSPQQQTISHALEQLRRAPWPQTPIDFGSAGSSKPASMDRKQVAEPLSTFEISVDRWTCRAAAPLIRSALSSDSRLVLVHAIDADPSVPLLAHWARLHLPVLLWLRETFAGNIRLVLPDDWPDSRREVKGARIDWVDPKYPSGHWRMLPHVLGLHRDRPLVLDAVAAVDLALHLIGQPSSQRPIAVCDLERSDPVRFTVASRGTELGSLLSFDAYTRWIAGPRWRRSEAKPPQTFGDGELVYYADRTSPSRQSPCIRCGWCEYICPTRCSPAEFIRAQHPYNMSRARRAGIDSCVECGLCTNVCPSNLPLFKFIERLKTDQELTP